MEANSFESVQKENWYAGSISERRAEKILSGQGVEGGFLVRSSLLPDADYVLSLNSGSGILHYNIKYLSARECVINKYSFPGIFEVIDFYCENRLGNVYLELPEEPVVPATQSTSGPRIKLASQTAESYVPQSSPFLSRPLSPPKGAEEGQDEENPKQTPPRGGLESSSQEADFGVQADGEPGDEINAISSTNDLTGVEDRSEAPGRSAKSAMSSVGHIEQKPCLAKFSPAVGVLKVNESTKTANGIGNQTVQRDDAQPTEKSNSSTESSPISQDSIKHKTTPSAVCDQQSENPGICEGAASTLQGTSPSEVPSASLVQKSTSPALEGESIPPPEVPKRTTNYTASEGTGTTTTPETPPPDIPRRERLPPEIPKQQTPNGEGTHIPVTVAVTKAKRSRVLKRAAPPPPPPGTTKGVSPKRATPTRMKETQSSPSASEAPPEIPRRTVPPVQPSIIAETTVRACCSTEEPSAPEVRRRTSSLVQRPAYAPEKTAAANTIPYAPPEVPEKRGTIAAAIQNSPPEVPKQVVPSVPEVANTTQETSPPELPRRSIPTVQLPTSVSSDPTVSVGRTAGAGTTITQGMPVQIHNMTTETTPTDYRETAVQRKTTPTVQRETTPTVQASSRDQHHTDSTMDPSEEMPSPEIPKSAVQMSNSILTEGIPDTTTTTRMPSPDVQGPIVQASNDVPPVLENQTVPRTPSPESTRPTPGVSSSTLVPVPETSNTAITQRPPTTKTKVPPPVPKRTTPLTRTASLISTNSNKGSSESAAPQNKRWSTPQLANTSPVLQPSSPGASEEQWPTASEMIATQNKRWSTSQISSEPAVHSFNSTSEASKVRPAVGKAPPPQVAIKPLSRTKTWTPSSSLQSRTQLSPLGESQPLPTQPLAKTRDKQASSASDVESAASWEKSDALLKATINEKVVELQTTVFDNLPLSEAVTDDQADSPPLPGVPDNTPISSTSSSLPQTPSSNSDSPQSQAGPDTTAGTSSASTQNLPASASSQTPPSVSTGSPPALPDANTSPDRPNPLTEEAPPTPTPATSPPTSPAPTPPSTSPPGPPTPTSLPASPPPTPPCTSPPDSLPPPPPATSPPTSPLGSPINSPLGNPTSYCLLAAVHSQHPFLFPRSANSGIGQEWGSANLRVGNPSNVEPIVKCGPMNTKRGGNLKKKKSTLRSKKQ